MKSPEPDQLAVRLPLITIDAKGPGAIRIVGRATGLLILAVAASIIIVSVSYAPSWPLWQALNRLYR